MRALLLLMALAVPARAEGKSDGDVLIAAGSAATAWAGATLVVGIGLFAVPYGPNNHDGRFLDPIAFGFTIGSVVTAAFACPFLVSGLNRRERARTANLSLAPTSQGAMVGVSGSF